MIRTIIIVVKHLSSVWCFEYLALYGPTAQIFQTLIYLQLFTDCFMKFLLNFLNKYSAQSSPLNTLPRVIPEHICIVWSYCKCTFVKMLRFCRYSIIRVSPYVVCYLL